jgi:hypothetical protein
MIARHPSGLLLLAGRTDSSDFPVSAEGHQVRNAIGPIPSCRHFWRPASRRRRTGTPPLRPSLLPGDRHRSCATTWARRRPAMSRRCLAAASFLSTARTRMRCGSPRMGGCWSSRVIRTGLRSAIPFLASTAMRWRCCARPSVPMGSTCSSHVFWKAALASCIESARDSLARDPLLASSHIDTAMVVGRGASPPPVEDVTRRWIAFCAALSLSVSDLSAAEGSATRIPEPTSSFPLVGKTHEARAPLVRGQLARDLSGRHTATPVHRDDSQARVPRDRVGRLAARGANGRDGA